LYDHDFVDCVNGKFGLLVEYQEEQLTYKTLLQNIRLNFKKHASLFYLERGH